MGKIFLLTPGTNCGITFKSLGTQWLIFSLCHHIGILNFYTLFRSFHTLYSKVKWTIFGACCISTVSIFWEPAFQLRHWKWYQSELTARRSALWVSPSTGDTARNLSVTKAVCDLPQAQNGLWATQHVFIALRSLLNLLLFLLKITRFILLHF
jgi:hypothetical protein